MPEQHTCESLIPEVNRGTALADKLFSELSELDESEFKAFCAEMPDSFRDDVWKWWMSIA